MKWWVCSHSGVDEDRERFLAAVDGYSWIVIVGYVTHTYYFLYLFLACTFFLASKFYLVF